MESILKQTLGLVGRDRELERLRSALDRIADAGLVAVELSGEAGIGKTTLLDAVAAEADRRRLRCLRVRGSRPEQDYAFGALASLLDDPLSSDAIVDALDPHDVRDLAAVLPSLRSRVADYSPTPADPLLVCRAVRHALGLLAKREDGLVVLLDDMHWVDEPTRAALGYLVRRSMEAPLLLATALRPSDLALSTTGLTQVAATASPAESIALGPIKPDDATLLLESLNASERKRVLREAGGNPFYLTQLADHARSGRPQPSVSSAYPPAVAATIIGDLQALSPQACTLAQAASVLGDPFDIALAGRVGQLSDETLEAVDELTRHAFLVPVDQHGNFQFRHPIICRVVYDSAGQGWRLGAHARAAALLTDTGADAIRVAHHVEQSAAPGDMDAIALLSAAARKAQGLSPNVAARFLESALRLLPESGASAAQRPLLMHERAVALAAAGRVAESHQQLLAALELVPAHDHTTTAALTATCVRVELWLGFRDRIMQRLTAALDQLPAGPSPERVSLEAMLIIEAADSDDLAAMRDYSQRAAAAAKALDQPYLVLAIAAVRAYGEARIGSIRLASGQVDEAVPIADGLTDNELGLALELLLLLVATEYELGRYQDAIAHARRALAITQRVGNARAGLLARAVIGASHTACGELTEAADVLEETEQGARMSDDPQLICIVTARRSAVLAMLGDQAGALAAAEECEALLALARDPSVRAQAAMLIGPTLLDAQQPDRCAQLVLSAGGGQELSAVSQSSRAAAYEILADAELARGDLVMAQEWAKRAAASAADTGLAMASCCANRAQAAVLIAAGEDGLAVDPALAAVDAAQSAGARLEASRARMLAATALAASGRRDRAVAALREAQETFEHYGARRHAAQAGRGLRSLGERTRGARVRSDSTGVNSLSAREREVAELVEAGSSNPQIAAQLFISRRTVESHLTRIFAKLGVRSREKVAAVVRRDGIARRAAAGGQASAHER